MPLGRISAPYKLLLKTSNTMRHSSNNITSTLPKEIVCSGGSVGRAPLRGGNQIRIPASVRTAIQEYARTLGVGSVRQTNRSSHSLATASGFSTEFYRCAGVYAFQHNVAQRECRVGLDSTGAFRGSLLGTGQDGFFTSVQCKPRSLWYSLWPARQSCVRGL